MSWLVDGYWPWWFGAIAFMVLVVGMWLIERRLLGVSGAFSEALKVESEADRAFRRKTLEDSSAIEDAMLKATLEEFGAEAVEAYLKEMAESEPAEAKVWTTNSEPLPKAAQVAFLGALAAGGLLGALASGTFSVRSTLGALHTALLHGDAASLAVLVFGGILVGFGTRMSGGCTSGHGLSGCSRFQVASLVATACFFGTAVAVSYLLRAFL